MFRQLTAIIGNLFEQDEDDDRNRRHGAHQGRHHDWDDDHDGRHDEHDHYHRTGRRERDDPFDLGE